MEESFVEQGVGEDCVPVLLWPLAFQVHLADAISESGSVQMREPLVEPLHLDLPLALSDERTRTDDENGRDVSPCL